MRVLVTGGTGFVGRHVVSSLLADGDEPIVLTRNAARASAGVDVVEGDLLDAASYAGGLRTAAPAACIHLGWYVEPGDYRDAPINDDYRRASVELVGHLSSAGCQRVVMAGTCLEYAPSSERLSEDAPTAPASRYAAAKLRTFHEVRPEAERLGLSFAWARLFYLYGPGQPAAFLVPSVLRALNAGETFAATDGTAERDYVHVEDTARALCLLARSKEQGVFNVCTGTSPSLRELLETIARAIPGPGRIEFGARPPRPDEPPRICGDPTRLRALGWSPRLTIGDT